jgi:adenylate cyclase
LIIRKYFEKVRGVLTHMLFFLFLFNGKGEKVCGQIKAARNISISKNLQNKHVADSLLTLGVKYQDTGNLLQALMLFKKSMKIYQALGKNQNVGDCFCYVGTIYYYRGNYSKALYFFKKSMESYKKVGYKKGMSSILNNMGGVYYYLGNYPKTLELYKQAVVMQEEFGDKKIVAALTKNIGGIYSKVEDYSNAMKYYNKAYSICKNLKDVKAIAQILNAIGFVYTKKGDYKKAFASLNQALIISDKENDKQLKIEVLSNLGELLYDESDFDKALSYYNSCLKYSEEINSLQYKSDTQIAIGNVLHKLGKNKDAIIKCKDGLKIAEKLGSVSAKKEACECLYEAYKSVENSKSALHFYEKVNIYKDSLQSEETSNKMMNMEFQQQQLVDSIANVKKTHAVQLKHKEEVQQQEKQRNIIIISLGFILVIAIGLWNRLNYTRKSRAALTIEKDRSEKLLLNILPEEIAQELKEKGAVNARDFNLVSILFSDFKSFTQTAEKMSPQHLVEEINVCFKAFDLITEKYNIEKIKTIGDSYMAAGGIPNPDKNAVKNIVLAGLEMQQFMTERIIENQTANKPAFEMRLCGEIP